MTIILNVQHTENDTLPKSVIFKQLRLPKDMKFYLKYVLNLNYLLTFVAEKKVILREMYSILLYTLWVFTNRNLTCFNRWQLY